MIAIAYLVAFAAYLYVLFRVMRFAWRSGRARGSVSRAALWSAIAFLALYLPLFWEDIPTLTRHRQLCGSGAGMVVHTTPETWIAAHEAALDAIRIDGGGPPLNRPLNDGWVRDHMMNRQVAHDSRRTFIEGPLGIASERIEIRLVDLSDDRVLAQFVDYRTEPPSKASDLKFWLKQPHCDYAAYLEFDRVRRAFYLTGK